MQVSHHCLLSKQQLPALVSGNDLAQRLSMACSRAAPSSASAASIWHNRAGFKTVDATLQELV